MVEAPLLNFERLLQKMTYKKTLMPNSYLIKTSYKDKLYKHVLLRVKNRDIKYLSKPFIQFQDHKISENNHLSSTRKVE